MDVGQPRANRPIRVEPSRHLELLRAEGERLAQAAAEHPAAAKSAVPGAPGRSVRDIVRHTGSVHRKIRRWVREDAEPADWEKEPPPGAHLVSWYREGLNLLAGELASRDPSKRASTWFPGDRTVGFWYRRMALETALHRVDVQDGVREELPHDPVDPRLAVDGIDEALAVWLVHFARESRHPHPADWHYLDGRTVAVVSGGHRWRVEFRSFEVRVRVDGAAAEPCQASVTGDPGNVLLYLWGRVPGSAVALTGDPGVLVGFRKRLAAVME